MYRKIVVVVNEGADSRAALQEYWRLDPGVRTCVHLLGIADEPAPVLFGDFTSMAMMKNSDATGQALCRMRAALAEDLSHLAGTGLMATMQVEVGAPASVVVAVAMQQQADLVIICHSRRKPWAARWWNDVMLIERLPCSVLMTQAAATPATPQNALPPGRSNSGSAHGS